MWEFMQFIVMMQDNIKGACYDKSLANPATFICKAVMWLQIGLAVAILLLLLMLLLLLLSIWFFFKIVYFKGYSII